MYECNKTITIYNSKFNQTADADVYIPTVIKNVSWFCRISSTVDKSGLQAANEFTIRIPNDSVCAKTYVSPSAYASADESKHYTIQHGDVIVLGEVVKTNARPAEIIKENDNVMTVLGVTDNRDRPHGKHIKVVGK